MAVSFRCGDTSLLRGLLDDRLSPDEQSALTAHLETCEVCRRAFDALAGGTRWWGELREFLPPGPDLDAGQEPTRAMDGAPVGRAGDETLGGPETHDGLDFLDPAPAPGRPGRFGPYEVTGVLGRGGMGVVLKAFDPALHRAVAVKVLAPQLATSATARKRFLREARAAASVVHEHVVTIHAVDEAAGLPYLVMQYVSGRSLQERIDADGPLGMVEVLRVGMQAASGLAAAHAQGLVHRDVKPANILLENGVERVKLTDFGLARAADDASLTQTGVVAGTPQYMAPEQARGEPVDHRADLFSLGSVLYAMCTGGSPFRAETTVAVLRRVCDETPRPVREIDPRIPERLAALIAALHAKDPADRPQTAAVVADLLGQCLARAQRPSHLETIAPAAEAFPSSQGGRRRAALGAAAGVLLVMFAGLSLAEATGLARVSGLLATVLRITTRDGTLVIEVTDPEVRVDVDGDDVAIRGAGVKVLHLRPGPHQLRASRGGVPWSDRTVNVSRGGRLVVRIGLEPDPQASRTIPAVASRGTIGAESPATSRPSRVVWKGVGSPVSALAYSPDGKALASAFGDGTVVLCDPAGGPGRPLGAARLPVNGLAFAPDGKTLASVTGNWERQKDDGEVDLWDVGTGKPLHRIRGHRGPVYCVAFAPDGKSVLAAGADCWPRLWDVATGTLRAVMPMHSDWSWTAAISPDGKTIATGDSECSVRISGAETLGRTGSLKGHRGQVQAVAFSPDGRTIASGGRDNLVKLWDAATLAERATLAGHTGWVSGLSFSPDGATLASSGFGSPTSDHSIRLWDVATSRPVGTLPGAGSRPVAFAPDGRSVASGDGRGEVKVWDVSRFVARRPPATGTTPAPGGEARPVPP